MKNHLSIELSIFSGRRSSLGGRGGSWSGETRLGEWPTVRLVLVRLVSKACPTAGEPSLNLRRDVTGLDLAGNEPVPGLGALPDDVHGVTSVVC